MKAGKARKMPHKPVRALEAEAMPAAVMEAMPTPRAGYVFDAAFWKVLYDYGGRKFGWKIRDLERILEALGMDARPEMSPSTVRKMKEIVVMVITQAAGKIALGEWSYVAMLKLFDEETRAWIAEQGKPDRRKGRRGKR
jgi:hypothetical protein